MTSKHPIETRLRDLISRFETWARDGGPIDRYISLAQNGMLPLHEEALVADANYVVKLGSAVEGYPNIGTVATESLDYQGDIGADWNAVKNSVADVQSRLQLGGATRWDNYSHTIVSGLGVIDYGSRTDATLATNLQSVKAAIQAFLANIP